MRASLISLFIITLLLTACGTPAAAPAATSQAGSTQPAAVAPTDTPTVAASPTQVSSSTPTPAATFTPTVPPPAVIGLDNFSQLATLHDYIPDVEAVINVKPPDYSLLTPVYSPDSKHFAVGVALPKSNYALLVLDVVTGDLVSSVPLGDGVKRLYSWNFSPDGQKLIYSTLSASDVGAVSIWDLATQKSDRVVWTKKDNSAYNTAFSPDGKQITAMVGNIFMNGRSRSLMVWDAATGNQLKSFPADAQYGVGFATFSLSGNRLILSNGKAGSQLTVYDTATWQVLSRISPPNSAAEVAAISPDGAYVMTSRQTGGHILLWDAGTGKMISALDTPFEYTSSMEFSPDGSMLIVSGAPAFKPGTDSMYLNAGIWDTSTWKQVGFQYWGNTDWLDLAPDGKSLLALNGDSMSLIGLPDQEIQAANQAVVDFTTPLGKGDYTSAAASFTLDSYYQDDLKSKGLPTDPVTILQAICEQAAFPCLPADVIYIARHPGESRGTVDYYDALVRFTKPDGSVYADEHGVTIFELAIYLVADGSYKVNLISVDLEAVLKK